MSDDIPRPAAKPNPYGLFHARIVPLDEAVAASLFGAKASSPGRAFREGLPVPSGFALSGSIVEAAAGNDERVIEAS